MCVFVRVALPMSCRGSKERRLRCRAWRRRRIHRSIVDRSRGEVNVVGVVATTTKSEHDSNDDDDQQDGANDGATQYRNEIEIYQFSFERSKLCEREDNKITLENRITLQWCRPFHCSRYRRADNPRLNLQRLRHSHQRCRSTPKKRKTQNAKTIKIKILHC